eukprot:gene9836-10846_t
MPIEIEARLLQRAVFFAGETVSCEIKISYRNHQSNDAGKRTPKDDGNVLRLSDNSDKISSPRRQIDERDLAWASAQIYCQCHTNENKIAPLNGVLKKPTITSTNMQTSFVATRDLYTEKIPDNSPPSYKGQSIRFSYKITIGIGSINGPTKLLRLPIRVLGTEDIWLNSKQSLDPGEHENPFLDDSKVEENSLIDVYLDHLTYSISQKNNNIYNISCSQGSAGKFSLSKICYRIGEDVQGTFDFTDSTVTCIKYKVALQSEECISNEFQKHGVKHKAPYISYSKQEESCLNCRLTHFSLPIPITATPEFSCNMLSLNWRIHCEFTTSFPTSETRISPAADTSLDNNSHTTDTNIIPTNIKIETMTWDVPVKIIASHPSQTNGHEARRPSDTGLRVASMAAKKENYLLGS